MRDRRTRRSSVIPVRDAFPRHHQILRVRVVCSDEQQRGEFVAGQASRVDVRHELPGEKAAHLEGRVLQDPRQLLQLLEHLRFIAHRLTELEQRHCSLQAKSTGKTRARLEVARMSVAREDGLEYAEE